MRSAREARDGHGSIVRAKGEAVRKVPDPGVDLIPLIVVDTAAGVEEHVNVEALAALAVGGRGKGDATCASKATEDILTARAVGDSAREGVGGVNVNDSGLVSVRVRTRGAPHLTVVAVNGGAAIAIEAGGGSREEQGHRGLEGRSLAVTADARGSALVHVLLRVVASDTTLRRKVRMREEGRAGDSGVYGGIEGEELNVAIGSEAKAKGQGVPVVLEATLHDTLKRMGIKTEQSSKGKDVGNGG